MANQNPLSDRDWLQTKQQFRRYVRREEYKANLADDAGVIDEPGYPGYVRVRYSQQEGNLSQPTTLPFEANMVKRTGAAVIVGYDDNGDLAVLRPDVATQRTQGGNTLDNNSSDPNVTYYIGQQRIITLNSHPISTSTASMIVTIQNWFYIKDGVAHYFTGGDGNEVPIDLTSYIPGSANEEGLACLFIKTDDTAEVITSTPKNAAIGLDIADVQECLDGSTAGGFPVWAWRVYNGQTGITPGDVPSGGDDFLDLRQFINVVMDTGGGSGIVETIVAGTGITVDSTDPANPIVAATGGGGAGAYILIQDRKTSGTNGGTFTSGSWQTRDLNTIVDDAGTIASVSSNQFTLPAGTYRIRAKCPAQYVYQHQGRLYNITDTAVQQSTGGFDILGTSEYTAALAVTSYVTSTVIEGRFTIAGTKTFEIQHQCGTTKTGDGFGVAGSLGAEVYTTVELIKE